MSEHEDSELAVKREVFSIGDDGAVEGNKTTFAT